MSKKKFTKNILMVFVLSFLLIGLSSIQTYTKIVEPNSRTFQIENLPALESIVSSPGGFFPDTNSINVSIDLPQNHYAKYTLDSTNPRENGLNTTPQIIIEKNSDEPSALAKNNNISLWPYPIPEKTQKATILRIVEYDENGTELNEYIHTYFIDWDEEDFKVPVYSVVIDQAYLEDYELGMYIKGKIYEESVAQGRNPENPFIDANWNSDELRWPSHFEVYENGELGESEVVRLQTSGRWSSALSMKSFKINYNYDVSKTDYPFFGNETTPYTRKVRFRSGSQDLDSGILMRDALTALIFKNTEQEVMNARPIALFLNGEYWGTYNLREDIDNRHFSYKYNISHNDVVLLEQDGIVGEGKSEDNKPYFELKNWLMEPTTNLSDNDQYEQFKAQVNPVSLIDYYNCHMFVANTDFPNDHMIWRNKNPDSQITGTPVDGRWQYFCKDADQGMGLYPKVDGSSTPQFNTIEQYLFSPDLDHWGTLFFRKAFENAEFRELFFNRTFSHLNSTLHPDRTIQIVEDYQEQKETEMQRQIERWKKPSNIQEWHNKIDQVKNWLTLRHEYYQEHLQDLRNNYNQTEPPVNDTNQTNETFELIIDSNVSQANIFINGSFEGLTPETLELIQGTYNVTLTKENYTQNSTIVNLNQNLSIQLSLNPIEQNQTQPPVNNETEEELYIISQSQLDVEFFCKPENSSNNLVVDWNFGDGNFIYDIENQVTHEYSTEGLYHIYCGVWDNELAKFTSIKKSFEISFEDNQTEPPVNDTQPPVNNETNQTQPPTNETEQQEYYNLENIPATCSGGTIVSDEYFGGRAIECSNSNTGAKLNIEAWDKNGGQYFEMYKKSQVGTGLTICIADVCLSSSSSSGFAKSSNYPIFVESDQEPVNDTQPPVNNETNQTEPPINNQTDEELYIISQSQLTVEFFCKPEGSSNNLVVDWNFGDGNYIYDIENQVTHEYSTQGLYHLYCGAWDNELAKFTSIKKSFEIGFSDNQTEPPVNDTQPPVNNETNQTEPPINQTFELTIDSNVSQANIFINGSFEGLTPETFELIQGTYNVTLTKENYTQNSTIVNLNQNLSIELSLNPIEDNETEPPINNETNYTDSDAQNVAVSQLGFHPDQNKKVIVYTNLENGNFEIVSSSNQILYLGELVKPLDYSGEVTTCQGGQECLIGDFSDFNSNGDYSIKALGKQSKSFAIDENVFVEASEIFPEFFDALRLQGSSYHENHHEAANPPFTAMADGSFLLTTNQAMTALVRMSAAYEKNPFLFSEEVYSNGVPDTAMHIKMYVDYLIGLQDYNGNLNQPLGWFYNFNCPKNYVPSEGKFNNEQDSCLIWNETSTPQATTEVLISYTSAIPAINDAYGSEEALELLNRAKDTDIYLGEEIGDAGLRGAALFQIYDYTNDTEYLQRAYSLRSSVSQNLVSGFTTGSELYWTEYILHKEEISQFNTYAINGVNPEQFFLNQVENNKEEIYKTGENIQIQYDDFHNSRPMMIFSIQSLKSNDFEENNGREIAESHLNWLTGMNSVNWSNNFYSRSFIFGIGENGHQQHIRLVPADFYDNDGQYLNGKTHIDGWITGAYDFNKDGILDYVDEYERWRFTETTSHMVALAMELIANLDAHYNNRPELERPLLANGTEQLKVINTQPSGLVYPGTVNVSVLTNKISTCSLDNQTMEQTGYTNYLTIEVVSGEDLELNVDCVSGEESVEDVIYFSVRSEDSFTCYDSLEELPAYCIDSVKTLDTFDGSCRLVSCESDSGHMEVLACEKGDSFEMYLQEETGSAPNVCFGNNCIGDLGFKAGEEFPICMDNEIETETQLFNIESINLDEEFENSIEEENSTTENSTENSSELEEIILENSSSSNNNSSNDSLELEIENETLENLTSENDSVYLENDSKEEIILEEETSFETNISNGTNLTEENKQENKKEKDKEIKEENNNSFESQSEKDKKENKDIPSSSNQENLTDNLEKVLLKFITLFF